MSRLPGANAVIGNRFRDHTGERCGAHVVTGPVGTDPLKSEFWHLSCPLCGYAPKVKDARGLAATRRQNSSCFKCGKNACGEVAKCSG